MTEDKNNEKPKGYDVNEAVTRLEAKIEQDAKESSSGVSAASRKEIKEADPEDSQGKRKGLWAVIIIAILLIGAAAYYGWGVYNDKFGDDDLSAVPAAQQSLNPDEDINNACSAFVRAEIDCTVTEEPHEDIERGNLVSQTPEQGSVVEEDTTVNLVYSAGPIEATIPSVHNQTIEEVKETLYPLGINVQEEYELVSGTDVAKDRVSHLNFEEGETVDNGTEVVLYVSDGTVEVPEWVGKSREEVSVEAEELGLDVTYVKEESEETIGTVLSQTPKSGEYHDTSEEIEVVVATPFEAAEIEVPDVLGKSQEEAEGMLAEAGFREISVISNMSTEVEEKGVTQTLPAVGEKGMSEERVVIVVTEPVE